jgi:hypothetical protein
MRLAVRYIESAVAVDEDAVRPRQRALKRIGLGTVTSLTGADDCCDDAGIERDAAYHVALGIGRVKPAAPVGQPFWTGEPRKASWPAIPRIALLASAGQMMDIPAFAIR